MDIHAYNRTILYDSCCTNLDEIYIEEIVIIPRNIVTFSHRFSASQSEGPCKAAYVGCYVIKLHQRMSQFEGTFEGSLHFVSFEGSTVSLKHQVYPSSASSSHQQSSAHVPVNINQN